MHDDIAEVLLGEEAIQARVKVLGEEISKAYTGRDLVIICILKGAVMFFADLARNIATPCEMDFMGISSYGGQMKTSGIVRISKDLDRSIFNKDVLIIEDIMDSGLTLNHLKQLLQSRNPRSLRIACLLDKPERRECDITPDYCGFIIPDRFVVGYGLDYDGQYRNLPYVGVLKPDVYEERP
ncbi:MAG: hypoxanthine phosphoribosyltransferase [Clostridiales bacterium]|nr:hypoxanthine phosphoribosyltransferase [Clostridiales bacterium]